MYLSLTCQTYTYISNVSVTDIKIHPTVCPFYQHSFSASSLYSAFSAPCPDGKASCSHNAVVIPPAHVALAPVNTLPIVSWTSFIPPAPGVPLFPACGAGKASYCTSKPT